MLERLLDPRILAVVLVLALAVLGFTFIYDGDGGAGQPSPTPLTPTPRPITATGTIGYITPDGNFALMNPDGSNQRVLSQGGGAVSLAWSTDGSVAAVQFGQGAAAVVRGIRPDGSVAFEVPGASPLWAPTGGTFAVVRGPDIALVDIAGSDVRVFSGAVLPEWSPDGRSLAFLKVGADGNAVPVIGDVQTGEETPLSPDITPAQPVFPIAWRPSGDAIAYRDRVYELETGATIALPGTAVFWSPDGRMLLLAGEFVPADNATDGILVDATQGFEAVIGINIRASAQDIPAQLFIQKWTDWTPDGRYFLYLDPDPGLETARVFDTVPPVSQDWDRNIAGERPDISPDGTHTAFMYQGKVWVMPLDKTTLIAVADGGYPKWQPTQ